MPSSVARRAAATERTPLRHSSTAFMPAGTAARSCVSKSGFCTMPGHCFQATAAAPGTYPTQARSASVRTSMSTASPACTHCQANCGETSPA